MSTAYLNTFGSSNGLNLLTKWTDGGDHKKQISTPKTEFVEEKKNSSS